VKTRFEFYSPTREQESVFVWQNRTKADYFISKGRR